MTFSHNETLKLIQFVLAHPPQEARKALFEVLNRRRRTEAEFCASVSEHGPHLSYSADQWFDFFLKIPNKLFKHETKLMNKLTPAQRKFLGFE